MPPKKAHCQQNTSDRLRRRAASERKLKAEMLIQAWADGLALGSTPSVNACQESSTTGVSLREQEALWKGSTQARMDFAETDTLLRAQLRASRLNLTGQLVATRERSLMDLHTHSTCSDGHLSPKELVVRAARNGVRVLALTDHDTMVGVPAATEEGARVGVRVIPGVEISTVFSAQAPSSSAVGRRPTANSVHILAYFGTGVLRDGGELARALARIRDGRFTRGQAMVAKLKALGAPVQWERVLQIAGPGVAPGRPHVAQALVDACHVASAREAFSKFLHDEGPAYASGAEIPADVAVSMIGEAGGVSVLAHPWCIKCPLAPLVKSLVVAGLHGMEVYRDASKIAEFGSLADAHGLLKLGGSDFHGGSHDADGVDVGKVPLPPAAALAFLTAAVPIWNLAP